jgi:hypothetical protein
MRIRNAAVVSLIFVALVLWDESALNFPDTEHNVHYENAG